jgi:hypothetical protein
VSEPGTPSPQSILAILLGASEWPEAGFQASNAFANSAIEIRHYLTGPFSLSPDNFLDLFDTTDSADTIDRKIGGFLTRRISLLKEEGRPATDLLLYFIGHGGFAPPNFIYCLAVRSTREANLIASSIQAQSLAFTIKENARHLRRLVILDCCFAASAYKDFQAGGPEEVAIRQLNDVFGAAGDAAANTARLPARGTTLLCSSPHQYPSRLSPDGQYTMFSEALSHALRTGDPSRSGALTMRAVAELARDYLEKQYPGGAPRPEIHSPDQREGDVADVPFFPNPSLSDTEKLRVLLERFVSTEGAIQCYVVISETEERSSQLDQTVKSTLIKYRSELERITQGRLAKPCVVCASQIMQSPEDYENAILAMCQAEIAIFDVTSYEPAVMLLLGVRSVVRRGVTLCSAGGDYVIGSPIDYPFNLREVNILSHSEQQIEREDPIDLIGKKLMAGFQHLYEFPDYLDLPAFEAIRRLPPNLAGRVPKDYTEEVLVLCPFKPDYQRKNWRHLKRNLTVYIRDSAGTNWDPAIVRTLDMKSPRLVSQSLYEAIRLTSMCIVDWTDWQPNVFFELGVRLAVSEIGAVCIIEDQDKTEKAEGEENHNSSRLENTRRQRAQFLMRLTPIRYKASWPSNRKGSDTTYFKEMVDYHKTLVLGREVVSSGSLSPDFTYKVITRSIDWKMEISAKQVFQELIESANLLSKPDLDTAGRSPVLYPGNDTLVEKAEEGALERRLAAWYYIDQRYGLEEILGDPDLGGAYEALGNVLAGTLLRSPTPSDKALAQAIREKVKRLRKIRRP